MDPLVVLTALKPKQTSEKQKGSFPPTLHLELLPPHSAGLVDRSEEQMASREARMDRRYQENRSYGQAQRHKQEDRKQW